MKFLTKKSLAWIRLGVKVAVLVLVLWLIFGALFGLRRMEGVAMSNRVEDGDLMLYSRLDDEYNQDDVVIFSYEDQTYVSVVIAKGGDLVEIDERGCLYVNHIQTSDAVVYDMDQDDELEISLPFRVPNDSYFVLNENLEAPEDSRSFGAIKAKDIKGKVISILRTRAI